MKKYFLTTAIMGMFIAPVFGADKIITSENTCTVDVLGVSDNNAVANTIATWDLIDYECPAGQYLLETETSVECTPCPTGSYCPGGTYTVESENNGKNTCPTDYTSDVGAVGENECYIGCELSCSVNAECPPHSTNCTHSEFKTTGKQFSGDVCNAYPSVCPITNFECKAGYNKQTIGWKDVKLPNVYAGTALVLLSCTPDGKDYTDGQNLSFGNEMDAVVADNGINDCEFVEPGHTVAIDIENNIVWVFQYTLNNYNDDIPGIKTVRYCDDKGIPVEECGPVLTTEYLENANFVYENTGNNYWYILKYIAVPDPVKMEILNRAFDEFNNTGNVSSDILLSLQKILPENAQILMQNALQNIATMPPEQQQVVVGTIMYYMMNKVETNLPWIYGGLSSEQSLPVDEIIPAVFVSGLIYWDEFFPDWTMSYCTNNTINIDWNPDNDGAHTINQCTYDGAITLPADPVKPGFIFAGWKLLENTTNE